MDSLPADHFAPCDEQLLAAYCCQIAIYESAVDDLNAGVRDPEVWRMGREGLADAAMLSVKLRLCPATRYGKRKAFTSAQRGAEKPWNQKRAA